MLERWREAYGELIQAMIVPEPIAQHGERLRALLTSSDTVLTRREVDEVLELVDEMLVIIERERGR